MLLKGCGVIAELVEEDAQRPDIALFVNWSPQVDVDHFWCSVLESRVPIEVGFKRTNFLVIGGYAPYRCSAAKIAELVGCGRGLEDVLDLEIAMEEWGLEGMHSGKAFANIDKDSKYL